VTLENRNLSERSRGLTASADAERAPQPLKCQICSSPLTPGLDLGHQPVGDLLLTAAQLNEPETFYPMQLFHCLDCGLCQLGYTVDPAIVYKDFPFVSGTTKTATRHLQGLARQVAQTLRLDSSSFAIDIGSNDGTLLKGYLPFGVKFLGVDPAALPVEIANREGIPTWHAFFNQETAGSILKQHGQADAISAAGCFAHIADLAGVMRGVQLLLKREGIFVTDNQYWLDMVQRMHYDNVFHQHLRNYSLKPLIRLFRQYDMDVFDVERSEVYGGSIRVFSCRQGARPLSQRLRDLIALEEAEELYAPSTFERFAAAVGEKRRKLFDAVYTRASAGQKVIGIGAPAKASTVCNYCGLTRDLLAYVTEVNPLRIGKFLPGVHIPIVEEEFMFQDPRQAEAGLLFAWNYYDEIVPKLRARGFQGQVLCP
jgi:C-methyltransferase C-terminal domain/Putative zinc binding domain/Methyltransferase domain